MAVVIVVRDNNVQAAGFAGQARLARTIAECSIPIIMEKK